MFYNYCNNIFYQVCYVHRQAPLWMCFHTCNLHSLYKHNIGKYWNLEILNIFLDIAIYLFIGKSYV